MDQKHKIYDKLDISLTEILEKWIDIARIYHTHNALFTKKELENINAQIETALRTTNGDSGLIELTVRQVVLLANTTTVDGCCFTVL